MKKGGGKSKGSGYERVVSRFLTKWLTGEETPYRFYRSPSSGAVATVTRSENISGDIISVKNEADFFTRIFSVEIKTGYKDADFFQHFKDMKNDVIKTFWIQCCTDADMAKKQPMLIFKKTGLKPIIGINSLTRSTLECSIKLPKSLTVTYDDGETSNIIFYDMETFFEIVTPDIIKKMEER